MDFIEIVSQYAWVIWLVLIAVFLVIEMLTLDMTFLMLSTGSLVGLISSFFNVPIWLQAIIAAIAAVLFILVLRPPLLRRLRAGEDPTPSNVDALTGLAGYVLLPVDGLTGQVKLSNGDVWTARTGSGEALPRDTPITVITIDGATAFVRRQEGEVI